MKKVRKYNWLLVLSLMGLIACKNNEEEAVDPFADARLYDEREQQVIDTLTLALQGTWRLDELVISFVDDWKQPQAGVTSDTTLQNLGILSITNCQDENFPQNPTCRSYITYQKQDIPVRFKLLASPERVMQDSGAYAFFLLELDPTDTSDDYDWDQPQIGLFRNINLINENFSVDLIDTEAMIWTGLNASFRGLDTIKFTRVHYP